MPTVFFELAHALKRRTQPGGQIAQADVAQIIRGQRRKQEQPQVRRGCTMCDDAARCFLEMIRRKPVIFGTDELLKKVPGTPRQSAKPRDLVGGQRIGGVVDRAADPVCDLGRKQPHAQNRQRHPQRGGIEPDDQPRQRAGRKQRRKNLPQRHSAGNYAHRVPVARPLQHVFAGDE